MSIAVAATLWVANLQPARHDWLGSVGDWL